MKIHHPSCVSAMIFRRVSCSVTSHALFVSLARCDRCTADCNHATSWTHYLLMKAVCKCQIHWIYGYSSVLPSPCCSSNRCCFAGSSDIARTKYDMMLSETKRRVIADLHYYMHGRHVAVDRFRGKTAPPCIRQ